ncbi:MAG: phage Gp37/Gp68 family protein [Treponema sp.]|jgi:protein gp37|nr:phage Gp37/Gp68 family protein [Treponema sp.]
MKTTKIEWTDRTWNPVTGCTKRSIGCANCYAEIMSRRLCAMGQKKYKNGFELTLHEEVLNEPLFWKNPHTIFVCSMSDLFHEKVNFNFIDKVLEIIEATPQHRYQLLTKRDKRMAKYFANRKVPDNVWLGVTVEAKATKDRIDSLRGIPASIRFLSCEPLLEDLGQIDLSNINWVIVGGESGKRARPMKENWVLSIEEQAVLNDSAFFFKQWGAWGADGVKRSKYANGKLLKGEVKQRMPG